MDEGKRIEEGTEIKETRAGAQDYETSVPAGLY
jgi:hypothetical protein